MNKPLTISRKEGERMQLGESKGTEKMAIGLKGTRVSSLAEKKKHAAGVRDF